MLSGKTFLITGATGRLGYETVLRLENLGATVQPLVLPGYPLEPKRVSWEARSKLIHIYGRQDLDELVDPDYVINFHWKVDRGLSYTHQLLFEVEHNVHLHAVLWEWLAHTSVKRFVNISTTKVFSHLNQNPVSSRSEPRPISPYGIAKLTAEKFFDAMFFESVCPVVHLRLCSVASPGEHPSHLMSQLYTSAYENRKITINKGHLCTIIYIDEAVDIIINAALIADSSRYIIATAPVDTDRIVSRFETLSGKKIKAGFIDLQPGTQDTLFESDSEQLRSYWTRSTSLDGAIQDYIAARNNGATRLFVRTDPRQNYMREGYNAKSS